MRHVGANAWQEPSAPAMLMNARKGKWMNDTGYQRHCLPASSLIQELQGTVLRNGNALPFQLNCQEKGIKSFAPDWRMPSMPKKAGSAELDRHAPSGSCFRHKVDRIYRTNLPSLEKLSRNFKTR
jgi:hypothetical protein